MKKMISFCGLACHECPAFLATQSDDDEKRAEVARLWSKQFKSDIKPDHVNCDGCRSESGRIFGYCQICELRKCGMEKKIANCAHCSDYACEKLSKFLNMVPDAKKRLEEIRTDINR